MPRAKLRGARGQSKRTQGVEPLQHLFNLFGLVFGIAAMDVCYTSLQAPDTKIRGTALEYLENQLPPNVKSALWPMIAAERADAPSNRPAQEILDELLASSSKQGQRTRLLEQGITQGKRLDR